MVKRTKLIEDPSEVVLLLRVFASELSKKVLDKLGNGWHTTSEIAEELGEPVEAVEGAISALKRCMLVDVQWRMPRSPGEKPEKEYTTIYGRVHLNCRCTLEEVTEVISLTFASDSDISQDIEELKEHIRKGNKSVANIAKDMKISPMRVKGIARRSADIVVKGHRIDFAPKEW